MNPCLLIPHYDHGETIGAVLESLVPMQLPCMVVDDGSDAAHVERLEAAVAAHPWVRLARRTSNGGKGAALKTGYRLAAELGHTHALQLDADGQHDAEALPRLLEAAKCRPEALVLAEPRFEAAPFGRRWGRWLSRVWVWIETGSLQIRDPLCGLRVMPLAPLIEILDEVPCGDRMDFDPEIAVRLCWKGVPVVNVPCRVRYIAGGVSHFDMVRDNARITWMHTRLVVGMLLRAPRLLARRVGGAR